MRRRRNAEEATLLEQYGHLGAPEERVAPERLAAEARAREVFAELVELVKPNDWGEADTSSVIFALEDLGSVYWPHDFVDPESMPDSPDFTPQGWRTDDWYDSAEIVYDLVLYRPDELGAVLGVGEWDPYDAGDLISAFAQESERFGGAVPDELFVQQIADTIYPDPRYGKLVLRTVPKKEAFAFVKEHHSTLGGDAKLPPKTMYAIGAYQLQAFKRPRLVAVALAGGPTANWRMKDATGQWTGWMYGQKMRIPGQPGEVFVPRRPACNKFGILELTRIASIGGLYRVNRKGKRVPLNASSMLAARMMDLLPVSGRHGEQGCLFTTYSMTNEKGTTYLSLVDKGLRPVSRREGKKRATGARAGGKGTAQAHVDKIRWEYGPSALPPQWWVLEGVVPPEKIEGYAQAFERYEARARQKVPKESQQVLFNHGARYQALKRKLMR